jgi:hypothetical protein
MIALVLVLNDELGHGPLEMPLAERIAIETFMFDGADEALSVGIRIRRPPRRLHNPNTAIVQQTPHLSAPFRVPLANQDAMRLGGHPKPAIDGHLKTGHHT